MHAAIREAKSMAVEMAVGPALDVAMAFTDDCGFRLGSIAMIASGRSSDVLLTALLSFRSMGSLLKAFRSRQRPGAIFRATLVALRVIVHS
jgi:hypothetical protein